MSHMRSSLILCTSEVNNTMSHMLLLLILDASKVEQMSHMWFFSISDASEVKSTMPHMLLRILKSLDASKYRCLGKKHSSGEKNPWEDWFSKHHIMGWRVLSAAGLQGKGSHKRSAFCRHWHHFRRWSNLSDRPPPFLRPTDPSNPTTRRKLTSSRQGQDKRGHHRGIKRRAATLRRPVLPQRLVVMPLHARHTGRKGAERGSAGRPESATGLPLSDGRDAMCACMHVCMYTQTGQNSPKIYSRWGSTMASGGWPEAASPEFPSVNLAS